MRSGFLVSVTFQGAYEQALESWEKLERLHNSSTFCFVNEDTQELGGKIIKMISVQRCALWSLAREEILCKTDAGKGRR